MADLADRRRLLTTAREDFLDRGRTDLRGVPGHVAASWRRSASSGVAPQGVASEYHSGLDVGSRLVRCARPSMEQLAEQLSDIPICVALTDDRARILSRRDTASGFARVLDRVYFAQGFGYAEGAVGTNGVGTVLEYGESVHIVGAEHFVDTLQSFACAGAPIRDPFTGRISGVLDISCLSDHSSPVMHSLVRSAARRVEDDLLHDRGLPQQALFDAFSRADVHGRRAVLAVGQRVVMANSPMQTLLDPGDLEALQDHVRFRMLRRDAVDERVDLPSGTRVRLRGTAVTAGPDVAGMVATVAVLHEVDTPAGPRSRPEPAGRRTPAWCDAASTVESALRAGDPVLLLGERGSGRLHLLTELHRSLHDDGRVVAIEADEVEAEPAGVAARVLRADRQPVLHVLRDVDRLSPTAVRAFVRALGSAADGRAPGTVAATASAGSLGGVGRAAPLTAMFRASATVPALRHRGPDLPALADELLAVLAPDRDVRLSRDALRLLGRHRWPGNVDELRDALVTALARRPVGTIGADDLPASCQSVPRSALRPVDEIERDAIVAALREVGGNRSAAAAALGLGRSTLYRKIRQYGISV
ncbi:transcriptional regulator of acetoin/glycerol metabolism [Pseudonocardia sediminis]|uniref:Transcriptional regulator of acetoin/glycerol metabolism n=1 Tax=Pseudonocardia sediminis TaxID=1397368 RepID=A0A4Q7V5B9_PSEST|nr:helix-turn-helix domain-containing protein [Pseudonocardia sediminis]RZT88761.1 transcriptional regulator of acetoin/glycerol metabolism [Pseudonocardia sediminis]